MSSKHDGWTPQEQEQEQPCPDPAAPGLREARQSLQNGMEEAAIYGGDVTLTLDAANVIRPVIDAALAATPAPLDVSDCGAIHPEHPDSHCRQPDGHSGPHMTARRGVEWDNAYLSKPAATPAPLDVERLARAYAIVTENSDTAWDDDPEMRESWRSDATDIARAYAEEGER